MDRQPKFKIGDNVRHLIEGHLMTIKYENVLRQPTKSYSGTVDTFVGTYCCFYTDKKGKYQELDKVPEEVLILA